MKSIFRFSFGSFVNIVTLIIIFLSIRLYDSQTVIYVSLFAVAAGSLLKDLWCRKKIDLLEGEMKKLRKDFEETNALANAEFREKCLLAEKLYAAEQLHLLQMREMAAINSFQRRRIEGFEKHVYGSLLQQP